MPVSFYEKVGQVSVLAVDHHIMSVEHIFYKNLQAPDTMGKLREKNSSLFLSFS